MRGKNIKKIKESKFFKPTTKSIIKHDLELIKEHAEKVEKEVEESIKDMYLDDFFKLHKLVLTG